MSLKISEFPEKLSYYLLDSPMITPEEYEVELNTFIGVFRRIVTPTIVRIGNVVEIQDPYPAQPDPYRTRLAQLVLDRLERKTSIHTYLERVKEVRNEFE